MFKTVKIKFNTNNPIILFLYLNSRVWYMKKIRTIVIIKFRIDIHIMIILQGVCEKVYIRKKRKEVSWDY
jgi:hypothetical protein